MNEEKEAQDVKSEPRQAEMKEEKKEDEDLEITELENSEGLCVLKKLVKEINPELRVKEIEFSLFNKHEISHISHMEVVSDDLYQVDNERTPARNGICDMRLGASKKGVNCETCDEQLENCPGHFSHIDLVLPVLHLGFIKEITRVLASVCKSCSTLLLSPYKREKFMSDMRNAKDWRKREQVTKAMSDSCKKCLHCFECGAWNGKVVKLVKEYRLVHDQFIHKKSLKAKEEYLGEFGAAMESNNDLARCSGNIQPDPDPLQILHIFENITQDDCVLLNFTNARPENMVISKVLCAPVTIRPSVPVDVYTTNEDDLTMVLKDIILTNNQLKVDMEKGLPSERIQILWEFLQQQVCKYYNSELPGFPASVRTGTGRPTSGLVQRIKGKQGRFRQNLLGKRVDFSGRTVISPDPNLSVNEVGVPKLVAMKLTYPEKVNKHNIETLRLAIRNGPDVYPGANFVEKHHGTKTFLKYDRNRVATARSLREGDKVERHLIDGDVVLFNRQPSLHRVSIMAHRVRVMPYRTFRFNLCDCNPYNADFDGDEMNLHVPQTEEARAEAAHLMMVQSNFVTPKNGEPLVVPLQDFLTACYLLTHKDVFYDRCKFAQICCYIGDCLDDLELPPPAILKPMQLWTGKQVFSAVIRPNSSEIWPRLGMELKTKKFVNPGDRKEMREVVQELRGYQSVGMDISKPSKKRQRNESFDFTEFTASRELCPRDGYVVFRNGELLVGNLDKKVLGSSKQGMFIRLIHDFSNAQTARVMNRLAKLCARWLGNRGFSIGIDDVTPSVDLKKKIQILVDDSARACQNLIEQFRNLTLKPLPGCNLSETLESLVSKELSKTREVAGEACVDGLNYLHNSPLIMAVCGSKGSNINIAQMSALVGQQIVGGLRIPNGFVHRSLPHFRVHSRTPAAKGFVANSFYTGLTPTEFFFHTMAGREGLVDTAVKTAETGYMQRRLMKALEDVCVLYDGTVRNSENIIMQFKYGEDGLDPIVMEHRQDFGREKASAEPHVPGASLADGPVSFTQLLNEIRLSDPCIREKCLTADELRSLGTRQIRKFSPSQFSMLFIRDMQDFVDVLADETQKTHKIIGLAEGKERYYGVDEFARKINGTTETQLKKFFQTCRMKFLLSRIEPGSAVGALAAQSIGEPCTQMTLKTFHFAGVASMSITLGVPRIKEIINASEKIATPVMRALLENDKSERVARIVKARIEVTKLGDISECIQICTTVSKAYIEVKLDRAFIDELALEIDLEGIQNAVILDRSLKLTIDDVKVRSGWKLHITPPANTSRDQLAFSLEKYAALLPNVYIKGIKAVHRAVIQVDDEEKHYMLAVEGTGLRSVIATPGIRGDRTTSNNIIEVSKVLGIEAARNVIIREIEHTMEGHGLDVDKRHCTLLADVMCFQGQVNGNTRHGIARMKESVMMLASFETPMVFLYDAAMHSRTDPVAGVSESIILGQPIPLGSGLFKMMNKVESHTETPKKPFLMDS